MRSSRSLFLTKGANLQRAGGVTSTAQLWSVRRLIGALRLTQARKRFPQQTPPMSRSKKGPQKTGSMNNGLINPAKAQLGHDFMQRQEASRPHVPERTS